MQRNHRLFWLAFGLVMPGLLLLLTWQQLTPVTADSGADRTSHPKWDAALHAWVNGEASTPAKSIPEPHSRHREHVEPLRYIVYLPEQIRFDQNEHRSSDAVVRELQTAAETSQRELRHSIDQLQAAGQIYASQPLWIINAIVVESDLTALLTLSDRADVAHVKLNAARDLLPEFELAASAPPTSPTWGIRRSGIDKVQYGLGITGNGVTVASMDSGVDWLHPALHDNYRGEAGNHNGHWFDATQEGYTTPVDFIGHGTHVMGTLAGQGGIGVAPGADWISVKIVDRDGFIFDSYVHLAFQWILAPNDNPALAPDIVNNSWGNSAFAFDVFWPDVAAIHAAGILTPFAAGNDGPEPGTILAPASYTNTLSVGAMGPFEELVYFSSRGPSPFVPDFKPAIVAPGAAVVSSIPDGGYAAFNGTSMATPHIAGSLALLLSANPALTAVQATHILTSTAAPFGSEPLPNHQVGWGMLNALAMVQSEVPHGTLTGRITHAGLPIHEATLTIQTPSGNPLTYSVATDGRFAAILQPGTYRATASAFGYTDTIHTNLVVTDGALLTRNFELAALSSGRVTGFATGDTLAANGFEIIALGTGRSATTDSSGHYALDLPVGSYTLELYRLGYLREQRPVTITAGTERREDFTVQKRPSVLLVNGNQWLYVPHIRPYRQSLDDNNLAYDEWLLLDPFNDSPPLDVLEGYDIVIWATPRFSSGHLDLNAANVISDYLGLGGNLLVSGQDVANIEGNGIFGSFWFNELAGISYDREADAPFTLTGAVASDFSGLSFDLNGEDSAQNQLFPDEVRVQDGRLARPLFHYANGAIGAVGSGECQPHGLVFFGFGLEGVTGRANRAALIERSLAQFATPPAEIGVEWAANPVSDFVVAGETRRYSLPFFNLSESITDTFDVTVAGNIWPTTVVTGTAEVGPCQRAHTAIQVTVPDNIPFGITQTITVRIQSRSDAQISDTVAVFQNTPSGELLFVDDDRWYDFEDVYTGALNDLGIPYDVWDIGWDEDVRGSPSLELLQAYPFVVWYTGYDWFRPVSDAELITITHYLDGGGRLFLSSQDFLFHHHDKPFSRQYLGLLDYQESVTPTVAFAGRRNPTFSQLVGQYTLDYGPYQNFSDGLVPVSDAQILMRHDRGAPAGVGYQNGSWRTVFWSLPLETLPMTAEVAALQDGLSWLSDLGDSTFIVSEPEGNWSPEMRRTYTLTLHYDGVWSTVVTATNPLPTSFTLISDTLTGGATYDEAGHQITWSGELPAGGTRIISYTVSINSHLHEGEPVINGVRLVYSRHQLPVYRVAIGWPGERDSSATQFQIEPSQIGPPEDSYTTTLVFKLAEPATIISGHLRIPDGANPIPGSLQGSLGSLTFAGDSVQWHADNVPAAPVTITLAFTSTVPERQAWLPFSWQVVIEAGYPYIWEALLELTPFTRFLSIIANS